MPLHLLPKWLVHPQPTLSDRVRQSELPQAVKELDLDLIRNSDDFDNATCGFGPDHEGIVYVAKHARSLAGFYHSCSCEVRHFRLPPLRQLPSPKDRSGSDVGRPDFLQKWMRYMMPSIGDLTLYNLCLPGTHDSLTYDLGLHPAIGDTIPNLGPLGEEPLNRGAMTEVRKLCACQKIDIEAQLSAGIRFFDFRVIYSRDRWVGVHGMETEREALFYLEKICTWLQEHPDEVVVLWLSRHGNETKTGNEQYPDVSANKKQEFYRQILHTFGDFVVDHQVTPLDSTPLKDLVGSGKQVVLICSDWAEPGSFCDPVLESLEFFSNLRLRDGKYHLVSLANSADKGAFVKQILPQGVRGMINLFGDTLPKSKFEDVPGMENNPWRLDHAARFTNYYVQTVLDTVWNRCTLPHAIYLDMVTADGGIEIGNGRNLVALSLTVGALGFF